MSMWAITAVSAGVVALAAVGMIRSDRESDPPTTGDTVAVTVAPDGPDDAGGVNNSAAPAPSAADSTVVSAPPTSSTMEVPSAATTTAARSTSTASTPSANAATAGEESPAPGEESGETVTIAATTTTGSPAVPTTTTTAASPPTTTVTTAATAVPSPTSVATTTTTTTVPPKSCQVDIPPPTFEPVSYPKLVELPASDPVCSAISLSRRLFPDADQVTVAHLSDPHSITVAAQLAARQSAPLLYYRPDSAEAVAAELERLAPAEVWLMEDVPHSVAPADTEVVPVPSALEDLMAWIDSIHPGRVDAGSSPDEERRSPHDPVAMRNTLGRLLVPVFGLWSESPDRRAVADTAGESGGRRLWMVDPESSASGLLVSVYASHDGSGVIHWDPRDGSGWSRAEQAIEENIRGVEEVWIVGETPESGRWFLEATLWGEELPGGGRILFPHRRLVAFYGAITTGVLGVLGEQDPAETLERMGPYLEAYSGDGIMTIPTFEIITTVAARDAGPDGDYSREFGVDTLMPWVEYAAQNGVYVVLDLQPGRSDFLSQAKQYERLLRFPHVGLALDPEWRLGPNERHLVQIGSVRAAEANRVIEWLAALVRRERLPQKLLIVHQFRLDMISSRSTLKTPPELAVMIHMDGQGSLGSKYNTWNFLTAGVDDGRWWWGWKNFFDEDFPLARPEQVLDLRPVAYFVSFQ